jgi:hypothetical protein
VIARGAIERFENQNGDSAISLREKLPKKCQFGARTSLKRGFAGGVRRLFSQKIGQKLARNGPTAGREVAKSWPQIGQKLARNGPKVGHKLANPTYRTSQKQRGADCTVSTPAFGTGTMRDLRTFQREAARKFFHMRTPKIGHSPKILPTEPNALAQWVGKIRGHLLVQAKVCAGAISECGISKRKDRMSRSKKEQGGASWFPAIELKIEKNLCANIGKLRLAIFCCATCASGFPQSRTINGENVAIFKCSANARHWLVWTRKGESKTARYSPESTCGF